MVRRVSMGARVLLERLLALPDLPADLRTRAAELLAQAGAGEPDFDGAVRVFLAAARSGLYDLEERWQEGGRSVGRFVRRGGEGGHGGADRLTIPLPDDDEPKPRSLPLPLPDVDEPRLRSLPLPLPDVDEPKLRSLPLPLPAAQNLASEAPVRGVLRLYDELLGGADVNVSRVHGVLDLLRSVVRQVTGADEVTLAIDRGSSDPELHDEPVPEDPPRHPQVLQGIERALRDRSVVVIAPLRSARSGEGPGWRSVAIVPVRLPLGAGAGLMMTLHAWSLAPAYWNDDRLRALGIFADLPADLVRQSRRMHELAFVDPMTGVLGRRFFELQLRHELGRAAREGTQLALCLVDVDQFKDFNQRFGHPGGDKALRHVARLLQERLRGSDWVARIGGDEFAFVLTSNVTLDSAELVAVRICEGLATEGCRDLPGSPHVTVTIGGAVFPQDAQDYEGLYQRASEAALAQKEEQRGRPRFHGRSGEPPAPAPGAGRDPGGA